MIEGRIAFWLIHPSVSLSIHGGESRDFKNTTIADTIELLNLTNDLGKRDKRRDLRSILSLFATSLINSILQEHEY